MNHKQRLAVVVGAFILIAIWAFPPWVHSTRIESAWRLIKHPTGYFFLFDTIQGEDSQYKGLITIRVDVGRLLVQNILVIAITSAAFVILRHAGFWSRIVGPILPKSVANKKSQETVTSSSKAPNGNLSNLAGCALLTIGSVIAVSLVVYFNTKVVDQQLPQTTVNTPSPPAPVLDSRRDALDKEFVELDRIYRRLEALKAELNLNDPTAVRFFNNEAASYAQRLQQARSEKAELEK